MVTRTEEIFLEAESDIRNSNYHEAFQKLESILYEEPDYAPAHNSIGWIYKSQFEDLRKAELHFKAAITADSHYPHPYFHLAAILLDQERFGELDEFLDRCMTVHTIDKTWVQLRRGMVHEIHGRYAEAIDWYEKALLTTLNNEKLRDLQADIERCHTKLRFTQPAPAPEPASKPWFSFRRRH